MAKRPMADSTRLYVDETTAPVLDPGRGRTSRQRRVFDTTTGYLWAVLRDGEPLRRHWFKPNGERLERPRAAGRGGRKGEYADEILTGFNGTIQVDAYGGQVFFHPERCLRSRKRPHPCQNRRLILSTRAAHSGPCGENSAATKPRDVCFPLRRNESRATPPITTPMPRTASASPDG